jgi:hypothetical protein
MVAGLGHFSRNSSHFRVAKATNRPFYSGVTGVIHSGGFCDKVRINEGQHFPVVVMFYRGV